VAAGAAIRQQEGRAGGLVERHGAGRTGAGSTSGLGLVDHVMRAATLLLAMPIALASLAAAADAGRATEEAPPVAVRTVKERLSSKASDDQRVNDCKVPHDLRGTKARPDTCPDPARTVPQR
jgi:hypothetical protein